jgi:membrane associated rhomboid family serine protease
MPVSGGRDGASGDRIGQLAFESDPAAPILSNPVAVYVVAAALCLVFAAQWWGRAVGGDGSGYAVYLVGGLHAASVREGEIFRIVTAPLLHLHVQHLGLNLGGLLAFGAALEAQVGHARFLLLVGLSMISGSLVSVALPPPAGVVVGASGALFGMIGAMAALVLRDRQDPPPLLRRVRWALPIVLVGDTALALLVPGRVGWSAHLGGFAGGMAGGAMLFRGAGPIPLGRAAGATRLAAAAVALLFVWGIAVDVHRIASGRICQVIERDDLSEAVRDGFAVALRDLPVACAHLEQEPPLATRADSGTPARSRTRSSASRRGP